MAKNKQIQVVLEDEESLLNFKSYKFKIHPTNEQKQIINQTIGCSRFVFNHVLKENLNLYENNKKRHSKSHAIKILPHLKEQYKWLCDADSIALQSAIEYQYEGFKKYEKKEKKELKKKAISRLKKQQTISLESI